MLTCGSPSVKGNHSLGHALYVAVWGYKKGGSDHLGAQHMSSSLFFSKRGRSNVLLLLHIKT